MLADYLTRLGYDVLLTKEPGGCETTAKIREILINNKLEDNEQFFLFLADRSIHVREVILPALAANMIVICDRYHASTLQYQREVIEWFNPSNSFWYLSHWGVTPTVTFVIDVAAEEAIRRLRERGNNNVLDNFDITHVKKLQRRFLKYAAVDETGTVEFVNGNNDSSVVHAHIVNRLKGRNLVAVK
jgi:dTMP kinase